MSDPTLLPMATTRMGRPRRSGGEVSSARINLICTPDERSRWKAKAAAEKTDLSEVIRGLLERWERGEIRARSGGTK